MSDPGTILELEEHLRQALVIPEPDPEFAQTLRSRLYAQAATPAAHRSKTRRMVWALVLGLVLLIALTVWIIGPQRVAAEVQKLFEYIPGFGIVEQNAPLRALEKPVSQTRDGITLTITQAFLSPEKTVVTYTLEGVPWYAYSHNEAVHGCIQGAALRLPDGTLLPFIGGGGPPTQVTVNFPPIPAKVDSFTFVLPCIQDTLPGLAPENWVLPLRVVPAGAALTAMPVIEVSPSTQPQQNTPLPPKNPLVLLKVIDTGDNYVLLGEFRQADASDASVPSGSWWSAGLDKITDASGQAVFDTVPYDPSLLLPPSGSGAEPWSYQIGKTFTPPLTITYRGQDIFPADPNATAAIDFDAGPSPQPGQEWVLNQDFFLAGHAIRLTSIQAVGNTGYEFSFESSDPAIHNLNVAISGYMAVGGGGGNAGTPSGQWQTDLDYTVQPKGKLEVVLSGLTLYGETKTWQLQWSPAAAEPGSPSLYGISMGIDRILSTDARTYLLGHTSWTDSRISSAVPVAGSFTATDSQGQAVPLEPANGQDAGLTLGPNQWLCRIAGNGFAAPLTLRATQMEVTFKQPVQWTLDLRPYGFDGSDAQLGRTWKIGLNPLEVPGLIAVPHWITYIRSGNLRGLDILIEADPALLALPFSIASGTNSQGTPVFQSGGTSTRDPASGQLLSTVLTKGNITFPMVLSASGETVSGTWESIWAQPVTGPTASPAQAIQP